MPGGTQAMRINGDVVGLGKMFDYHYTVTKETDTEIFLEKSIPATHVCGVQPVDGWNADGKLAGLAITMPVEEFEKQYGIHPEKPETWERK